ncbi:3-methyladenine DNA glycosylase [Nocardioides solisilvae]|uniref:3-methyladenine DNA glycosylase n=1 Tax=Nocardioides solisilvae TaxID=1542435 RepID=UPI001EF5753D|nr:3-methyladenine DNA glycosylase [Nocardioides solisilvae]
MRTAPSPRLLDEDTWRRSARAHADRVEPFVAAHLSRRGSGVKHPVHDFLFTYYSQRPAQLRRWHPGFGVALAGADEHAGLKGYERVPGEGGAVDAVSVSATYVAGQRPLLVALRRLLAATAARPASYRCFGLHEWAMVHRLAEDETRHADWPLRLGPEGTDAVVEGHRIACSHFDAYRFFTPSARPLNVLRPGRDDRVDFEQPGCLHAAMDLYKHAFRLTPMVCSDLVADCFELARDVRVLDMRAAPYDLSGLDVDGEPFVPVRIETPEGKQEYAAAQRRFAERAAPLRARLLAECDRLLAVADAVDLPDPAGEPR